jgi:hypothetical protein
MKRRRIRITFEFANAEDLVVRSLGVFGAPG